ncbi:MFS transporter [Vibrio algivorus]|uniref:MFS transporter n=1 Tax=Vibrio algivorus TaxID=1667024 RepID=A0A557P8Q7_9VIBR|nr:MFS transporter [Vibrio algivorus]TVO37035.1 MFS transporter [Vibrio algivorus]GLT14560.1 MFS transporter [Vibrio algivorus]
MNDVALTSSKTSFLIPVAALSLYAVASGYLMSLIPLMLGQYGLSTDAASWLASAFYAGLLLGAMFIEPIVAKIGHKNAFVFFLVLFSLTIVAMPIVPAFESWLFARFIAGIAVAGIFVVVESWLLIGDEKSRAKRLGLYMASLYGGATLGQLGISVFAIESEWPFVVILSLLVAATLLLCFGRCQQPQTETHSVLSLKQVFKMNKAALIGCMVSGLLIGSIYGLMPLELHDRHVSTTKIGSLMALLVMGAMLVQPIVSWGSQFMGKKLLMGLFCLLGVFAIGLTTLSSSLVVLAISLVLLGMATFSIYPLAISLGCDGLEENYIVSATQIMLLAYSIGSVAGPIAAQHWMNNPEGLTGFLFVILLATSLYMFAMSIKRKSRMVAGE